MALAVEINNNTAASPWLTPTKRSIESPCAEQRRKTIATPNEKEATTSGDPIRKVSFSKKVRVVEYFVRKSEKAEEYTPWYTKEDFKTFQKDRSRNMQALRLAQGDIDAVNKSLFCLRGLEDHISVSTRQEKALRKISLVQAVLDEQKRQRMTGTNDDNALCTVSTIMSEFGRRRAREFGLKDSSENDFLGVEKKLPSVKTVPLLTGVANPMRNQRYASSA